MHIPSPEGLIALDHGDGDLSFVSHAHSDHLNGARTKDRIIASEETVALAGLPGKVESPKGVKLLEAGHILGSRQILVDSDGIRTAYTGDVRTRPSILFKGAEIPECDKLIIEATYGNPRFRFPDYYDVYSEIEEWVRGNPASNLLIGGYALGKAQELIKILNSFGVAPVVDRNIERFNSVYEKFGAKLDRTVVGTPEAEELMAGPFVGIVEMKRAKRYFARRLAEAFGRETLVAVATGWALSYRFDADASFVLSDHADFHDLVGFVRASGAKEVEFVHGDGAELQKRIA